MKRPRKLLCFSAALLMLLFVPILPAHADTGDATLQITGQPAKLILQLGPGWAGTQFELRTDAGMYPGTVVVGNDGILRMDIGGSKTFTLSRVQTETHGNVPTAPATNASSAAGTPNTTASMTPNTDAPTTDIDLDNFLAGLTESGAAGQSTGSPEQPEESEPQGVPLKQILLLGGGIIAAVIALVILSSLRKRRADEDEEEDYED